MAVDFCLLGEFGVRINDRPVDIGHARQQCVLVALLLEANRAVPAGHLADRVWGGRPPPSARGSLHSYLSRLRQILAPAHP